MSFEYARFAGGTDAFDRLVVFSFLALLAIGLVTSGVFAGAPLGRAAALIALALLFTALAWLLRRIFRCSLATALVLVWLVPFLILVGAPAVAATALLATASVAIGSLLVDKTWPAWLGLSLVLGLAIFAALSGWLLALPVHYWWIYAPLFLALIVWRRGVLASLLRPIPSRWRGAVAASPRLAVLAISVLGVASTSTWLPTLQFDDLSFHLGLPWQLLTDARYSPAVTQQMWAYAPWAGDVIQGIAQVLAGREARGAIDALWLLLPVPLLWAVGERVGLGGSGRWLCIALFASQPLTAQLAGGMQSEAPSTAMLLALALAILSDHESDRCGLIIAILGGALLALKVGNAWLVLVMLAWFVLRHRHCLRLRRWPAGALIALLVGGSSYVYALIAVGNPIMPLANAMFQAPGYPAINFVDMRWQAGLSLALPWQITFHTGQFMESWDGAAGFQCLGLLGAWIVALRTRAWRGYAIAAMACALGPLLAIQYLRYAYPGIVLMLPVLLAGMVAVAPVVRRTVVVTIIALNVIFQPNAFWLLHVGTPVKTLLHGRDAVTAQYVPERAVIAWLREDHVCAGHVLSTDPARPFLAELGTRGLSVSSHAPALLAAAHVASSDRSGESWRALWRVQNVCAVLTYADPAPALATALETVDAHIVKQVRAARLWQLPAREDGQGVLQTE